MSTSALSFNREASLSASFVQLIKASNEERGKPRKIPSTVRSQQLTALTDWSTIENFHLNFPTAAAIHTRVAAGWEGGCVRLVVANVFYGRGPLSFSFASAASEKVKGICYRRAATAAILVRSFRLLGLKYSGVSIQHGSIRQVAQIYVGIRHHRHRRSSSYQVEHVTLIRRIAVAAAMALE